jgi:hypothetical protein
MAQPRDTSDTQKPEYIVGAATFYANHFGLAVGDGEAILELGSRLPKRITGEGPQEIPIEIVARIVMTERGLRALDDLIRRHLDHVAPTHASNS